MKKLVLLSMFTMLFSLAAFARAKTATKSMTVKEYFLAIPTDFLKADAKKRAEWIQSESSEDGYLAFEIPVKEVTGEDGNGKIFGDVQVFNKKKGGVVTSGPQTKNRKTQ